jgi:beta-glucosidase
MVIHERLLAVNPDHARVEEILARLTLDEKVAMLYSHMPAVDRLGLPAFHTGGEAVHGVVGSTPGTVFPQAVGLGATWNPELLEQVGETIGTELGALLRKNPFDPLLGRNLWAPVVNLLRDARWGRNEEGYSEDPFLTATLAIGYCRGLAGDGGSPRRMRVAPTLKHFVAYNHEGDKFSESVDLRPRVFWEYEIRPFFDVVKEGVAAAVMPSFHVVNGRPNHVSEHLRVLREAFGDLVVVADGFAPSDIVRKSHYYDDRPHAYAAAMRAGLDSFTDHFDDPTITLAALHEALALGLLSESDVDESVRRLLRMRVRLGEFDDPTTTGPEAIDTPEHRALAREAVRQAIVLLRNDGLLPFTKPPTGSVAVIGPLADQVCRDWYGGPLPYRVTPLDGIRARVGAGAVSCTLGVDRVALRPRADCRYLSVDAGDGGLRVAQAQRSDTACFDVFDWGEGGICLRSVANGLYLSVAKSRALVCTKPEPHGWDIKETFRLVRHEDAWLLWNEYSDGYATVADDGIMMSRPDIAAATPLDLEVVHLGADRAANAARHADAVVLLIGTYPHINGREMRDREDVGLPAAQERLAHAVIDANPDTVVVLVSGHPLAVPRLAERIRAMLWSSHGGQEFGNGLADVLFGAYSPAGRLPQTWPRGLADLGDIRDYDIISSRLTYLYSQREPLYPFGHGLSYTAFRSGEVAIDPPLASPGDRVTVGVEVENTGPVDADEVVQMYVRALQPPVPRPRRELRGFQRVWIPAGKRRRVELPLSIDGLAFWEVGRHRFSVTPGPYEVMVGRSSAAIEQSAILTVRAPAIPPRDVSSVLVRAVDFDDYERVQIIDEVRLQGEAIVARQAGAWLLYRDVDLGAAVGSAVARLGGGEPGAAIEIRLDDPVHGRLLGTLAVPTTDTGRYGWGTVVAPLAPSSGRHDVYLVFTAGARLASFSLCRAEGMRAEGTEDECDRRPESR